MWWAVNIFILTLAVVILPHLRYYLQFTQDYAKFDMEKDCFKVGDGIVGPEDMVYSELHNVIFISSHDHRDFKGTGSLYFMDALHQAHFQLQTNYPPQFRPHGMTLVESEDLSRLFVISHRYVPECPHSIEVFDLDIDIEEHLVAIKHVHTLCNKELLSSPNDVIALSFDQIIVSNDHGPGGSMLQGLLEDAFHIRRAAMAYFNGFVWQNLPDSPASFGNGLIITKNKDGVEYLYRASTADYSLQKFKLTRGFENNKENRVFGTGGVFSEEAETETETEAENSAAMRSRRSLELVLEETVQLPIAADNIMEDPTLPGALLIAGHPLTYSFMGYALLPSLIKSPSAVLRYYTESDTMDYVYMDDGSQLSASSTAIRTVPAHLVIRQDSSVRQELENKHSDSAMYISQVFSPYLMYCHSRATPPAPVPAASPAQHKPNDNDDSNSINNNSKK